MAPVLFAAAILTVAAAVRSTWSPCGLSMLSSMTPLSERSRGHRYWVTALWYLAGSVAGGVTLGACVAAAAAGVDLLGLSATAAGAIVAIVAAVTGAADLGIGPDVPRHRRQVNEDWFSGYRRWVYASGFGWQIGNGFATYTTTAALYAVAVGAIVSSDPLFAFALGVGFGTIRGLAVGLGFPLTDISAVRRMHARLDAWAKPSRVATAAVQLVVAVAVAATVHVGLAAVLISAAGVAALVRYGVGIDRSEATSSARGEPRPAR